MGALIVCNIPCLACIVGAVYLIATQGGGSTGWGWLLLIAFLLHCSPSSPADNDCDCDNENGGEKKS